MPGLSIVALREPKPWKQSRIAAVRLQRGQYEPEAKLGSSLTDRKEAAQSGSYSAAEHRAAGMACAVDGQTYRQWKNMVKARRTL